MEKKNEADLSESELESDTVKKLEYRGEFYGEQPYYIGLGLWSTHSSEESGEKLTEGSLSVLESAALICILKDAIDELIVLKYIIGAPSVACDLKYKTLTEKYTRRLTPVNIFPEASTKPVLTSFIKLQRDRAAIETVFKELTITLTETGSYSPLTEALENLRTSDQDDLMLIEELKKNLSYMRELRIKVEEKKKMDDMEEKGRVELMYQLQDELNDVMLKCEVEEKFIDKWENVRNAQNKFRLNIAETYYKDNINRLNIKIKLEKRVTHELQLYLKTTQAELEDELENWMARYDSEMERRENQILQLRYDKDQMADKKNELEKLYEGRKQAMKEWVQFRELRKMRAGASLIIQSWWRGMMVRKKLGPYKPKKGKK